MACVLFFDVSFSVWFVHRANNCGLKRENPPSSQRAQGRQQRLAITTEIMQANPRRAASDRRDRVSGPFSTAAM